ncbi:hypothetical protein V2J09_019498 [Rumex salicifolius]
MEKEPLLPLLNPRTPAPPPPPPPLLLSALPENEEVTHGFTPSSLKERLIFGPSLSADEQPSPSLYEALASYSSPRPSFDADSSSSTAFDPQNLQPSQHFPPAAAPGPFLFTNRSNLHRSKTAPAMAVINDLQYPKITTNTRPHESTSQAIVKQAVLLLILYLALGVLIYWFNRHQFAASETHPVVDALYFCIVTMCTIGYGDITPSTPATKLFSVLFVLVGFGFIDILLSGMVCYVLDLQENYLLKTVKAGKDVRSMIVDVKKGRMRIRMKVGLALGVVVLCIGVGVGVMHFVEQLGWIDSFYLSVMSVTTVGYGDHAFKTLEGRLFASIWLLVSTLAVARAFLYLAEARVDRRHRRVAKWVLGQEMTVAQFLAADMDNNGFVSKSEYVIYKLKEMGKVSEKDVLQICRKFDQLDTGNCGKITLADLMHCHNSKD